jgi:hypothetical protein
MTLLQSWADSLTLFKPKNLQAFVLMTFKSIVETYKIVGHYFWWVILLIVMCAVAPYFINLHEYMVYNIQYKHVFFIVSVCLYQLLFIATCLSARSSIEQKDSQYFIAQFKRMIFVWLFVSLFVVLFVADFDYVGSLITSHATVFTILFFADSESYVEKKFMLPSNGFEKFLLSLWKSIVMTMYNLPLMMIVTNVMRVLIWVGSQCIGKLVIASGMPIYPQWFLFDNVAGALLLPIFVCLYSNIYIKKVHDQFDFYFKRS